MGETLKNGNFVSKNNTSALPIKAQNSIIHNNAQASKSSSSKPQNNDCISSTGSLEKDSQGHNVAKFDESKEIMNLTSDEINLGERSME